MLGNGMAHNYAICTQPIPVCPTPPFVGVFRASHCEGTTGRPLGAHRWRVGVFCTLFCGGTTQILRALVSSVLVCLTPGGSPRVVVSPGFTLSLNDA